MIAWISLLALLVSPVDQGAKEVGVGPAPAMTPVSWEMEFTYLNPPRKIDVGGTTYFYLVYKVTNNSAVTQRFFPTIQLVTEDLRVIETDSAISNAVFEAIRLRHQATHPHLLDPVSAIGDLPSGADNARESVAIWRAADVTVNNFSIFVAGISGEARLLKNPSYDQSKPEKQAVTGQDGQQHEITVNPKYFTLRKTLELRYAVPGSESARPGQEPELVLSRWIMR
ncbi:MAG: hypothetical protein HZB38_01930 [Planctomycetes bacterium]|nr:hypothetical protein [Planctomycetota bacterium]